MRGIGAIKPEWVDRSCGEIRSNPAEHCSFCSRPPFALRLVSDDNRRHSRQLLENLEHQLPEVRCGCAEAAQWRASERHSISKSRGTELAFSEPCYLFRGEDHCF